MSIIIIILLVALLTYICCAMFANFFYKKGYTAQDVKERLIIAHRGGANLGNENTLSCFAKGIETGADMIEFDIHLSKDDQIVVCHDRSINRTTDGSGRISQLTLADIQKHHVLDHDGNPTREVLPTLDDVLTLINGRCKALIEIKKSDGEYIGIENKLIETINAHNAKNWCVIQSFNDSVLFKLHELDSTLRLEKLLFCKLQGLQVIFDGTFTSFSYEKYSFISSFNFYYHSVTNSIIDDFANHGKEIKVWTVTTPDKTPTLNVQGYISDNPDTWTKLKKRSCQL